MSENITAEMIKQLRERTGVGMGKCKEALVESNGDLEKAIDLLRKKGMASAVKKEGREAKEGLYAIAVNDKDIALVEVNCETDFVAKNEKFVAFAQAIAEDALAKRPQTIEEFMAIATHVDPTLTVDAYRNLMIQMLGENILIRKLEIIPKTDEASYGIYSHMNGKIVSIVKVKGAANEENFARDLAMHVAAEEPLYLSAEEIPSEERAREEEIARSQIAATGKPANIVEKILSGKMQAYYDQSCFLNQKFIKDPSLSIQQVVENYGKKAGKSLTVDRFWRRQVGK